MSLRSRVYKLAEIQKQPRSNSALCQSGLCPAVSARAARLLRVRALQQSLADCLLQSRARPNAETANARACGTSATVDATSIAGMHTNFPGTISARHCQAARGRRLTGIQSLRYRQDNAADVSGRAAASVMKIRETGQSGHITSSSIATGLQPGSSRSSSQKRSPALLEVPTFGGVKNLRQDVIHLSC